VTKDASVGADGVLVLMTASGYIDEIVMSGGMKGKECDT